MPAEWRSLKWITDDLGDRRPYRRCVACRCWLPANLENFTPVARFENGVVRRWDHRCRPCRRVERREYYSAHPEQRAKTKERHFRRRQDPRVRQREREYKRGQKRIKTQKDIERDLQRYREMRRDPVRWARRLNQQRENYKLRKQGPRLTYRSSLPVGALVQVLIPRVARLERLQDSSKSENEKRFVEVIGVDQRTFFAWKYGERKRGQFSQIDRALVVNNLNWFDVYQPPSNGHASGCSRDVLRYIADVEEYFRAVEMFTGELTLDFV